MNEIDGEKLGRRRYADEGEANLGFPLSIS